jgi:hypothetical protein
MDSEQPEALLQLATNLFKQGYTTEEIATQLRIKGATDNLLQQALGEIKTLRLIRRRNNGFIWCGIGSFLLVAGCMLTFLLHSNGQSIRFAMYSLTTIGVIIIMKGLIDVFGW